jgi:UDP-N-acetylmuramoyl-tripeptide--D-alanyl-D-alanine ligase
MFLMILLKRYVKRFLISVYSGSAKRFLKNNPKLNLVGVSGSVGKTSTKLAITKILREDDFKVLVHEGAYNDPFATIFVLLDVPYPDINNPVQLIRAFLKLRRKSRTKVEFDYAVLELGTDTPGEMRQFGKFLSLDICIITAITPEHMINFKSFNDVAREEIEVCKYSKKIIAGKDLIPREWQRAIEESGVDIVWFGTAPSSDYSVKVGELVDVGLRTKRELTVKTPHDGSIKVRTSLLHLHSGYIVAAAIATADICSVGLVVCSSALEDMEAPKGRGRLIPGKKGSIIIDDSYNNVGANVSIASLDLLYDFDTRRRIVVLGGINELSEDLEQETHTQVALHLKEKKLEEVVLIGSLAKKYYKPILVTSDIKFRWFSNPYKAGNYLQDKLVAGMVILVKGSQNGIYSEEAIKPLLQDPRDANQLVRQSEEWLEKKKKSFGIRD